MLAGSDSIASTEVLPSTEESPLNQGFTEGGDLTLQSLDGLDFSVYSLLLSLASPVFSDMFALGTKTKENIIPVGETSEMLALMLKFIYPLPSPPILSFDQLSKALHVADKYQLNGMKSRLREQLVMQPDHSSVSMSDDPLRALAVASAHGLHEEADESMSLASKRYNFQQADGLARLAEVIPSAVPFIRLFGVQSVRIQTLADVLLSFHKDPMQLNTLSCSWSLCMFCKDAYYNTKLYSAPEWQARWAYAIFTELKSHPVQEWDSFFKIGFFNTALHRGGQVPIRLPKSNGHCGCPSLINESSTQFERWTGRVQEHLKTRLLSLGQLEQLKISQI